MNRAPQHEVKKREQEDSPSLQGSGRVLALILVTYGAMLAFLLYDLREQLREETLDRISAVASQTVAENYRQAEEEFLGDPDEALKETALLVLGVHAEGVVAFGPDGSELDSLSVSRGKAPSKADFDAVRKTPQARFQEPAQLTILIPVGEDADVGFILLERDGSSLAAELEANDGKLLQKGLFAFVGGGGLILVVFLAFLRRLRRSREALAERTEKLVESNQRLAQACKAAGVGAVTSHLMHALKNPLAGLRDYARERREEGGGGEEGRLLTEATDRIQSLVEETLGTLSETEVDEATYSFSVNEILEIARQRLESVSEKSGVELKIEDDAPEIELDNLRVNLLVPILLNLGHNAIEATTEGEVKLGARRKEGGLEFRVQDDGGGVPDEVRDHLFRPVQSSKPGGSGVGLAICRELAERIDAEVGLEETGPNGSRFVVRLPLTPEGSDS